MQTRRKTENDSSARASRAAWYTYAFGNTSVQYAIPYYLTPYIVTDLGVPALAFGLASAASSWAIGLSGPFIGVNADEKHRRRHWFIFATLVAAILLAALGFLPHTGTLAVVGVLFAAMLANYFFQLSGLISNASMLRAAGDTNVVSVSSLGMGLSFIGGVFGIGVIQLFISGRVISGMNGRGFALAPAAIVFLLFALPSIFARRLWQNQEEPATSSGATPEGPVYRRMLALWRESSQEHRAGWFLAGYFALNSAVMGLTLYLILHIQAVTSLTGMRLWAVLLGVVLSSAAGAGTVALIRPSNRLVRRIILVVLALWALNAFAFSLVTAVPLVVVCSCLHGLFSGALVPAVRGAFAQMFRPDYQALAFGLFGVVQRVSQGLGAALSPLAGSAAGGQHTTAAGIAAMGILALIGIPLFAKWRLSSNETTGLQPSEASVAAGKDLR